MLVSGRVPVFAGERPVSSMKSVGWPRVSAGIPFFKLEYIITPGVGPAILLRLACAALHLLGGSLGYLASDLFGFDERTCRTVAIVSWLT